MRVVPRRLTRKASSWARQVVDDSAERAADHVTSAVNQTLERELEEITRMLRQQGDASAELAETFGRTLVRLSEAVEGLHERLDRLEASERPGSA